MTGSLSSFIILFWKSFQYNFDEKELNWSANYPNQSIVPFLAKLEFSTDPFGNLCHVKKNLEMFNNMRPKELIF